MPVTEREIHDSAVGTAEQAMINVCQNGSSRRSFTMEGSVGLLRLLDRWREGLCRVAEA